MSYKVLTDDSFNAKMDELISAVQSNGDGSSSGGVSLPKIRKIDPGVMGEIFDALLFVPNDTGETVTFLVNNGGYAGSMNLSGDVYPPYYELTYNQDYSYGASFTPCIVSHAEKFNSYSGEYEHIMMPSFLEIFSSSINSKAWFSFGTSDESPDDTANYADAIIEGFTYIKMTFDGVGVGSHYKIIIFTDGNFVEA